MASRGWNKNRSIIKSWPEYALTGKMPQTDTCFGKTAPSNGAFETPTQSVGEKELRQKSAHKVEISNTRLVVFSFNTNILVIFK